jgi:CRP-like cAMP-binding protein
MDAHPDRTLQPLVRKLGYLATLDAADEKALLRLPFRKRTIERHGYVVREHERATHACLMLSGYSIRHKIVREGARQIVAVNMKGDMVDLQNSFLQVADHSVQMLTDSEVAFIPRDEVRKIAFEHPNVGMAMWLDTLVDGAIFREWIANIGRRDALTRVAHLLCEFSLRLKVAGLGEESEYELPMTQEEIGDCTALTSIHVNRMLKQLESRGLIERRGPRTVTIGDWRKLVEAGDFDSTYLHLRHDEPALRRTSPPQDSSSTTASAAG